jgi:hypothetical protein
MTYDQINRLRAALRVVYEAAEDAGVADTLDLVCRELEERIPGAELYLEDLHPDMDPKGVGPLLPVSKTLRAWCVAEDMTLLDWFHDTRGDFTRVPVGPDVRLDDQGYGRECRALLGE